MKNEVTLKDQFKAIKRRFIDLTDEKTFETEVSFALQHVNKNPQLKKADVQSVLEAVMNVAQVGLSLNPVNKLAYLVPRSENVGGQWIVKCCLEPSYQGLCKLVTDTGSARQIYSHPVYEGDDFEVILGSSMEIVHRPKYKSKEITHVYMVAILSDGAKHVEVMTREDVDEIRGRSESYKAFVAQKIKSCVWVSDYSEMARKTVIRRGVKYLPKTDMWDKVSTAISLDESDYMATDNQLNYIESLLMSAAIDPDEQGSIFSELSSMSAERARHLIDYLNDNQVDQVAAGNIKSMGQINDKLDKHV